MANFEQVVRSAVSAALMDDAVLLAGLNRVGDGGAAQAALPYAQIGEMLGSSWGTKDRAGREVRVSVLLFDRGDAARIAGLSAAAEVALSALPRLIDGWETGGAVILRTRLTQRADGLRAAQIDVRVRGWLAAR